MEIAPYCPGWFVARAASQTTYHRSMTAALLWALTATSEYTLIRGRATEAREQRSATHDYQDNETPL